MTMACVVRIEIAGVGVRYVAGWNSEDFLTADPCKARRFRSDSTANVLVGQWRRALLATGIRDFEVQKEDV